ncbi:T9SS type A sorting domain-containing protein [Fluviicola sp.]|jgi:hypothetical protein|uniref:T9SS type A sorting domain-containing protein n=1 Tax=Fluviicola sp. TaxID=1917219 RepID=UPI002818CE23|nr:T9SS type A sorting domain-containing protein [Fluviicola sp.]MDR0802292.1 T9SS type A sorting domain-containing protein [Fluviicola sp.]
MKTKFLTLVCIGFAVFTYGQYQKYVEYITPFLSGPPSSGFYDLITPNNFLQPGQLYEGYKAFAGDPFNDMLVTSDYVDNLAQMRHVTYQQTYKNIPVEAAGCVEHFNSEESLSFINAKMADSINQDVAPQVTPEYVLNNLLLSLSESGESVVDHSGVELLWAIDSAYNVGAVIPGSRYTLVYAVLIYTSDTWDPDIWYGNRYYIDPQTGEILKIRSTGISETTGINEIADLSIVIYPNPTGSMLIIELPQMTDNPIQIMDISGNLVKELKSDLLFFQTDISGFANGVYLVKFNFKGNQIVKRIIVQK